MIGGCSTLQGTCAEEGKGGAVLQPDVAGAVLQTVLAEIVSPGEVALIEALQDPFTHNEPPGPERPATGWALDQGGERRTAGSMMSRVVWLPASWDALMKSAKS